MAILIYLTSKLAAIGMISSWIIGRMKRIGSRLLFRQIFRNKSLLPILFILPMIQLLIMPMAANFDVRYINIAIADKDRSTTSQQLITKIGSSGYFHIVDYSASYEQALR